jgi:adenine/guanine phosphoribosyltransferase-like PRPP-binding protein
MKEHKIDAALWYRPLLTPGAMQARFDILRDKIESTNLDFDTIAFSGFSGALFGPTLGMALNKYIAYVRPSGYDNCHSIYSVEGPSREAMYIIVDDLVDTGNTLRRIITKMAEREGTCVGIFFYAPYDGTTDINVPISNVPVYYYQLESKTWECLTKS